MNNSEEEVAACLFGKGFFISFIMTSCFLEKTFLIVIIIFSENVCFNFQAFYITNVKKELLKMHLL